MEFRHPLNRPLAPRRPCHVAMSPTCFARRPRLVLWAGAKRIKVWTGEKFQTGEKPQRNDEALAQCVGVGECTPAWNRSISAHTRSLYWSFVCFSFSNLKSKSNLDGHSICRGGGKRRPKRSGNPAATRSSTRSLRARIIVSGPPRLPHGIQPGTGAQGPGPPRSCRKGRAVCVSAASQGQICLCEETVCPGTS